MYGLYGFSQNIQNIYRLSAPFRGDRSIKTTTDLKPCYLGFINQNYQDFTIPDRDSAVVEDHDEAHRLLMAFSESRINDLHQERMVADLYDTSTQKAAVDRTKVGIKALAALSPEHADLLGLAVHSIVISDSRRNKAGFRAHGGTSNKLVGMMWLTLKPELSEQDIQEMLIHELTHTLVFLDELNFGHFNYDHIAKKEYWARSSILNRSRPMDKVIHSIVVATEILFARVTTLKSQGRLSVHPDSPTLKANALAAIESVLSLRNLEDVCLPRSIELTQKARNHLTHL